MTLLLASYYHEQPQVHNSTVKQKLHMSIIFQTISTHLVEGSMSEPTASGAFLAVGVVGTA